MQYIVKTPIYCDYNRDNYLTILPVGSLFDVKRIKDDKAEIVSHKHLGLIHEDGKNQYVENENRLRTNIPLNAIIVGAELYVKENKKWGEYIFDHKATFQHSTGYVVEGTRANILWSDGLFVRLKIDKIQIGDQLVEGLREIVMHIASFNLAARKAVDGDL